MKVNCAGQPSEVLDKAVQRDFRIVEGRLQTLPLIA
jgi:hypothetical protein